MEKSEKWDRLYSCQGLVLKDEKARGGKREGGKGRDAHAGDTSHKTPARKKGHG